ncbi:dGTP triphosphohydrolase inhibitor [Salmonella phage vB_SalM-LPST153]|uniref:dGTP triphosphohydrolase inhibitor n=1 Tax=Salmonella phage vB_SalM-LPST153 TaxID=2604904 RepID=A0A6M2Z6T6_9CAUD|nr:dGTP triphosphohydrolase inhibitor [Salmonella phage vB_SalM-LPST153]QEP53483.1 deoxyguanosine triphosphohydrolase inhibitor [Salmonella phage LPST144]
MGRLYSGSLAAYKSAIESLEVLGCNVKVKHEDIVSRRVRAIHIEVSMMTSGDMMGKETFMYYDDDVLFNTCTAWMRKLAEEIRSWK